MRKKSIVHMVLATVFLVSTVSLGSLAMWESPAQAAPPDKQKVAKLRIDDTRWDGKSQFVVDLSCERGIANAGNKNKNFLVSTELHISMGVGTGKDDVVYYCYQPIAKLQGATPEPDEDGMVQLESQYITWDRDSGNFTGEAWVTTTVVVKNRSGHILWNPVRKLFVIDIQVP